MAKEMLINVSEGEECRIALLEDGKLEELYMERTSSTSHVGNIYKGRVTNVEASIQAAFVDFGLGRNGFLHISDLMPTYFGRKGDEIQESVGRKMARRDRPPIQRCLRRGDEIIVQIIKEGIGTKGPTLSTYLSIPGRILVMMPGMGKMGVSKKIEDEEERRKLRTILDSLKPPKGVGFIIRTAGIGKTKAEIQRDLTYLSRLWTQIEKKRKSGSGPMELYTEGDLVTRTVRDVFSSDVDRIIVDSKDVAKQVKEVIKITAPRTKNKVEIYEEPIPLFHKFNIERDIELMYSRHVPLPSGGSLVIDSTEAIVAIDVNSGKFRDHSDAEMTAFKTDLEAAEEIPRQLKLRDLGGVIICDFIDLRYERHRRELEEKLHDNFKKDRAKTKVLRMSQFGIVEITRQRMRPSLKRSIYFDCPHCKGAGLVKTPESMSLDVMRRLAIAANDLKVARIELSVNPDVSFYLLNRKRVGLAKLEEATKKRIIVRNDPSLGLDEMKFDLFDLRDGLVVIEELGLAGSQPPHTTQLGTRPHGGGRGRGGRDRGRRGQPHGGQQHHEPPRERDRDDERFELDETADANAEREESREPVDPALVAQIAPKIVKDVAPGEEEEYDGDVVDVEDGHSELGERPAGEWDRRGDRDRNRGGGGGGGGGNRDDGGGRGGRRRGRRGGRGRGRNDGGSGGPQQQAPPQQQQRPPVAAAAAMENYGDEAPIDEDERPGPGNEKYPPPGRSQGRHDQRHGGRDQRSGGRGQGPTGRSQGQGRRDQQGGGGHGRGQGGRDPQQSQRRDGPPGPGRSQPPMPKPASVVREGQGEPRDEQGEARPGDDEGAPRRRRRRGGRRHRRRRERERLERERAAAEAAGLPPPQPVAYDDRDDEDDDDESTGERGSEIMSESRPVPTVDDVETDEDSGDEADAEVANQPDTEPADDEPAPKKKRGRRPASRKAPARTPPPKTASVSDDAPVIKTGSADKHLVDDEPVEPQPTRRPRGRHDLDAIPDDYD